MVSSNVRSVYFHNGLSEYFIKYFIINYVRLQPTQSLINGLTFTPECITSAANVSFVCYCEDKNSTNSAFNTCSQSSNAVVFSSVGVNSCLVSSNNDSTESTSFDDLVLSSDYNPAAQVSSSTTAIPSSYTWPTASGITNTQADRWCRVKLSTLVIYSICVPYVDLLKIVSDCVFDIGVSCPF